MLKKSNKKEIKMREIKFTEYFTKKDALNYIKKSEAKYGVTQESLELKEQILRMDEHTVEPVGRNIVLV